MLVDSKPFTRRDYLDDVLGPAQDAPWPVLKISRDGRSLVEWLDANTEDLKRRSIYAARMATMNPGDGQQQVYIAVEQTCRTLTAIRAAI